MFLVEYKVKELGQVDCVLEEVKRYQLNLARIRYIGSGDFRDFADKIKPLEGYELIVDERERVLVLVWNK